MSERTAAEDPRFVGREIPFAILTERKREPRWTDPAGTFYRARAASVPFRINPLGRIA